MIKQKLVILCLGTTASLFGLSDIAKAESFGFSMSINDPIFSTQNGTNNVPDFQLENISDASSGVQITGFTLTIGETSHTYDFIREEGVVNDPGNDFALTLNAPDRVNSDSGTDVIDYDFTGFDPGDIFRFEVDVDVDGGPGTEQDDYRSILFPNAVLKVEFSNGSTLFETFNPEDTRQDSYRFERSL